MARHRDDRRERDAMRVLSALRFGLGVVTLVAPGVLARLSGVAPTAGAKLMARVFGSREVALAVITLDALESKDPPAAVIEANMLVDGLDGVAGLIAGRKLPAFTRAVTVLGAVSAVATAAALRSRLR